MARHFRIHPAIGVARVGNAPDAHFIGPEHPGIPANWAPEGGAFSSFRDNAGRIQRQAARFRVFEYDEDDRGRLSSPREVRIGGDIVDIEWRVHLANRKASFFTFHGQSGASDAYATRSGKPATAPEKSGPDRPNRRNANVPEADRARLLEIDPGEQAVSNERPGPAILTNPNSNVPFIHDLGEIRLDEAGRLLVLGGHGVSGSAADPPGIIDEYANNDTWFDDVGDGSVKARIRLADGSVADADAAWVLVGPPDFAPGIGNVVTLYDTLWDIAVRTLPASEHQIFTEGRLRDLGEQKRAWAAGGGRSLQGYRPSFTREIYPLLARAFAARHVHDPGEPSASYHHTLIKWERLESPDSGREKDKGRDLRGMIFRYMRNPSSSDVDWEAMPRGLGDDYDALAEGQPKPTSFLSQTQIQYALLEQWAKGEFISDWPGEEPGIPVPGEVTPEGLDRAALESSVGGPFFPGIEVGWLIRRPELYAEAFRLKVPRSPGGSSEPPLRVGAIPFLPGFFTQQMALPWQADFYDCHKEELEGPDGSLRLYMWWTAQRPDDVFPAGATERARWVRAFDSAKTTENPDDHANLERFQQMRQNWAWLRFIIKKDGRFEEEP